MLNKRRIYEFDDFRVDTGQFFLTRAGRAEPITPTVFRILLMLLEHAGEVVTKEELMKNVWPDSFVEEGNLNRNVSTLRKALGEKPCDHRCIETIPKTGYRFIAPTRVTDYKPPAGTARKMCSPCIQHIVGREVERDILQRTYDQVQQGRGALVCINGDVGLGKTALVDAFVEDLLRNGQTCHLARARCSDSFTENEPLMPWIENVSALAEEPTVREALVKTAPTWHREISHSGSSAPRQMKRELLDFYKEISSIHPVIIVLDDFHWADVGSIDLLAFLAPRLESLRVMVIVCYRQTEMKIKSHLFLQVRSDLLSRGACTEILLARLSRTDVEQYVALEQPNVQYAPDYAETLHAKSEGNPMFMRELLHESNGRSESIQHLIQSRLDRLDDTHHQLLVTASVQGREFDSAVLAAAMQMNSQDVEESLQVLDDVYGLIRRTREEELPDGKFTVRYRFAYQLYQEACYSSLAPTRKASLSASLAEAFLTYYGN
jgi:predicted ATPase/DNA-binding winged helix-turn-helix (wHTH) protein